jgi:3-oxoadipate enol-lactonase
MVQREFSKTRDGLKIRYDVRGAGDPVALIMGFSASSRGWGEEFLKPMEERFKLYVIDNRGTGESDQPDQPWTLADMAADAASVLDHAQVDRAHIFGISMGGMIAQEFVLAYPQRTRGLMLGCTNCGSKHSAPPPPEAVAALIPDPAIPPAEQVKRALTAACGKAFVASPRFAEMIAQIIAEAGNYPITPMHTYQRQMQAIMGFDSYDRLPEIKAPTLIIHGDDDAIVPYQNGEILNGRIAGSRLSLIRRAGHMFFREFPQETVAATVEWFSAAM